MPVKPQRSYTEKLKDKYRLIIYNDNTFEEVGFIRLKGFNLLWIIGALAVALIAVTFSLIAYTGIKEFIPGYPDTDMRRRIVLNALKLDSVEHELKIRDVYFENISSIIAGKTPENFIDDQISDSLQSKTIHFTKSEEDSLFRKKIEEDEQFNLPYEAPQQMMIKAQSLSQIHFFPPVKGIVTNSFNAEINHYGTDIVAKTNEVIKSVLDGTVIIATWTIETGYIIQIQHENNLISIYKHNSELLKRVGNHVEAGEVIAIIGNSGEFSTGPHLHFELWNNGRPVNPENYIVF